ncbi:MAG: FAD synthetase family protein [Erythrobacter sp.]|nr:FAD synthetase family protein [Erythrobacter sp.]
MTQLHSADDQFPVANGDGAPAVFPDSTLELQASVIAIGAFDGVHLGHQKVIGSAVASARRLRCPSVVYTFDTPPKAFFAGAQVLTTVEEKLRRIGRIGADCAIVARFDRAYAARSAEDFIAELAKLNPREIWVGADFRFGARSSGDVALLARSFNVKVVDAVRCELGKVISSTRIRQLLQTDPRLVDSLLRPVASQPRPVASQPRLALS